MTETVLSNYTSGPICLDDYVSVLGQYPTDHRWNGWLCPGIDAWSVQKVIEAFPDDEFTRVEFEGEPGAGTGVVIFTEIDGVEEYVERLEPDEDGLYELGAYCWTWSEDPLYYFTDEYKAWVRERARVWSRGSNASNSALHEFYPDINPGARLSINTVVAEVFVEEWEKSHPEPPKDI